MMEIRAALKPGSEGVDEQFTHKALTVTAIEIAYGGREAKAPDPTDRAITSQLLRLTSHEAHSTPDFSRAT